MSSEQGSAGKAFDGRLFARVMRFVQPYRMVFWGTLLLTILLSGLGVLRPVLMGDMIDNYALTGDGHGLLMITLLIMGLLLVEAVAQFYQSYWTSWLGQAVTLDLRQKLYRRIIGFKLRYFDRTPIGTLVTRAISDIETIEDIFSQGLLLILSDILKLVVVVLVMFLVN